MLVAILSALLNENDLINAGLRETLEMFAQLVRRSDTPVCAFFRDGVASVLEGFPDVGTARLVRAEQIVVPQCEAEETEPIHAPPFGLFSIFVAGEARHHCDVCVDRMTDRHAVVLDDVVVLVDPLLRVALVDEGKCQGPHSVSRSLVNRRAVRARQPERWVRALNGLGHDVATGHGEVLALVAWIGVHHQHIGDLLGRLAPHLALGLGRPLDVKTFELRARSRLPGAEIDPPVGD